jgi:hypothetical protein
MRGARVVDFQLAPEAQDLYVDAAVEPVLVNACCLEKMLAGQWSLRCIEECHQERVLAFGQCQGAPLEGWSSTPQPKRLFWRSNFP